MNAKQLAQYIQIKLIQDLISSRPGENIDADTPTLEWCERIAKKHGKAAKDKIGKGRGKMKAEILERVKSDPDTKGKKPK